MFASSGDDSGRSPFQQQQYVSALRGTPSSGATTTTAAAGSSSDPQQGAPSGGNYEQWASPAELVEMRTMWSDVLLRHKQEVAGLTISLKRVTEERDGLLREVQETQQLRELYAGAREQFRKAKEEQARWEEERQMLVLRLQKLQVDQLENPKAGNQNKVGIWGGSGASSGSTIPLSGESQPTCASAALSVTSQEVQYMEAIYRLQQQLDELQNRSNFQQTTDMLRSQKQDGKIAVLTAEIGLHQQRRATLEQALSKKTAECEALHEQLEHTRDMSNRQACDSRVAQSALELELDRVKAEFAVRTEDISLANLQRVKQMEAQLATAIRDNESTRDKLTASLAYSQHASARRHEQLEQLVHQLEVELVDMADGKRAATQDLDDNRRRQQQSEQLHVEQVRSLTATTSELLSVKATLTNRLDLAQAELHQAQVVQEKLLTDLEKIMIEHRAAIANMAHMTRVADTVPLLQQKIADLEGELGVQREMHEQRLEQTNALAEAAVRRAEEEVHAWMKETAKWQRKCGRYIARDECNKLDEHENRIGDGVKKRDGSRKDERDNSSSGKKAERAAASPSREVAAAASQIDVLELLKASAQLASDVKATIAK